jgi:hypothetical protein
MQRTTAKFGKFASNRVSDPSSSLLLYMPQETHDHEWIICLRVMCFPNLPQLALFVIRSCVSPACPAAQKMAG